MRMRGWSCTGTSTRTCALQNKKSLTHVSTSEVWMFVDLGFDGDRRLAALPRLVCTTHAADK